MVFEVRVGLFAVRYRKDLERVCALIMGEVRLCRRKQLSSIKCDLVGACSGFSVRRDYLRFPRSVLV